MPEAEAAATSSGSQSNPSTSTSTSFSLSNASTAINRQRGDGGIGSSSSTSKRRSSVVSFYGSSQHAPLSTSMKDSDDSTMMRRAASASASATGPSEAARALSQEEHHQQISATNNSTTMTTGAVPGTSDNNTGTGKKSKLANKSNAKKDTASYKDKKTKQSNPAIVVPPVSASSTSDAPIEQDRRKSVAMSKELSNSSNTSTRSLPARATRSSNKRKYAEHSSDSDEETAEEDLLPHALPSNSRQKGKRRALAGAPHDEGTSTSPPTRSTSPEDTIATKSKQVNGSRAVSADMASGPSVRPKRPTASRQPSKSKKKSSSSSKSKSKKKRIEISAEPSPDLVPPPASAMQGNAPSYTTPDEKEEERLRAIEIMKEEAASTSDSSVSTPLASNFQHRPEDSSSHLPQASPLIKELQAKLEPMSEGEDNDDDNDNKSANRTERAASDASARNESRAPTTSRPTSAEAEEEEEDPNGDEQQFLGASSRASASSEPMGSLLPSGIRSVSAMDGGDELSTAGQSSAMPSPVDEMDSRFGTAKSSLPSAPRKKRGRPPKRRPNSETPAPAEEVPAMSVTVTTAVNSEEETPTFKTKYRATLDRERQLIQDGTHPLFLEALVAYDKIRQEKIAGLHLLLTAKEEATRKALEAKEKSLWESWQDERRKLWYEMTLTFSRKQRQLVFEKDMLEAEAIDPTGLFGTAKAILWPDRDPAYVSAEPPVVEPIIRVPIPAKPPPKGRTRRSNRVPVKAGEALVRPLNTTSAQGISSLSGNEIALDLEIMGLTSRSLKDNWFYNATDAVEAEKEEETMQAEMPEDRKPLAESRKLQKPDPREISAADEYLPPNFDDLHGPPAGYAQPAPYDYVWPPYADPRYPTSPHYHPYYPAPPHPSAGAAAGHVNFNFPSGPAKEPSARQPKAPFSFPQGRNLSYDGKEGHSRDDAIIIDDELPPAPAEGHKRQLVDRGGVARPNGSQPSYPVLQPPYQPTDASQRDIKPRARGQTESRQSRSGVSREGERATQRYPANAYQREYQRGWTPEDHRLHTSAVYESPDSRSHASPPQHVHIPRERRVSGTEREHDYVYHNTPEQAHLWTQQHANTRYRPYYEATSTTSGHLDDAVAGQYGYPHEFSYDQWGRPVDPYHASGYLHPAYAEAGPEQHSTSRRGPLPPPVDPYRDTDRRLHYRQYSAQTQSDEQIYPHYESSYAHSGAPGLKPGDNYPPPLPRRISKTSADEDHSIRTRYAPTYSPQHR